MMRAWMKYLSKAASLGFALGLLAATSTMFVACDNDNSLEDAAEEVGDAGEHAVDEVQDAADDVGDGIDDAMN